MIDLAKPKTRRDFTIRVFDNHGTNNKTISLYGKKYTLDFIHKLVSLMIIDDRKYYLDYQKRFSINGSYTRHKTTHTIQISRFDKENTEFRGSKTITIKEDSYNANEIADILDIWLKEEKRKAHNLDFYKQTKVYKHIMGGT